MSQSLATLILVLCFAVFTTATDSNINAVESTVEDEMDPRFGFLALDNSGATVTFNSTSLQYAVLIGIVLIVVALIAVPLISGELGRFAVRGDGYGNNYGQAYEQSQGYSTYSHFAKRSLDVLSPVLVALSEAYRKYEDQ